MGAVIGALAECGYGLAWRVLDASAFGVPQRRRRVFIVGNLGGTGHSSAEVLFEPESLRGDSQEGTEPGKANTRQAGSRFGDCCGGARDVVGTLQTNQRGTPNTDTVAGGQLVVEHTHTHVSTLQGGGKRGYRIDAEAAAGGHLIVSQP